MIKFAREKLPEMAGDGEFRMASWGGVGAGHARDLQHYVNLVIAGMARSYRSATQLPAALIR
ncbi:MAG: hypothetical protein C4531_10570 [Desulfurivibrio sp.]|nr:MAG: hypothetical protein C4531_10570 [Desulfurivibrio sp.]